MSENSFEIFIKTILDNKKVWLLESHPGMFALLEDADERTYLPLWESREKAQEAAVGEWCRYNVEEMGFAELEHWLAELNNDEIDLAVSPKSDGKILSLKACDFRRWLKPYVTEKYIEPMADDDDDIDFGDGWAEKW